MFKRNIDFLAVFFIAVAMLGFSKASSLRLAEPIESIQLQKVGNVDSCPFNEALSRIAYILNQ
jgi:hypothetical protein